MSKKKRPRITQFGHHQRVLEGQLFNIINQGLRGGGLPDLNLPGASPLQQRGFALANQFGTQPFSEQGQTALSSLLSGQPAFQITPELIAQRNQQFNQTVAPAEAAFQRQLGGLQQQFADLGLTRSGGILDASAQAAKDFGSALAAQRAGIFQGDIDASIASREAALARQGLGLQLEQGGRLGALGALLNAGQQQRGIGVQQAGNEFSNALRQNPAFNPFIQLAFPFIGLGLPTHQRRSGGGSGIGGAIGTGLGALGGFFAGGPIGAVQGAQIGGQIGSAF